MTRFTFFETTGRDCKKRLVWTPSPSFVGTETRGGGNACRHVAQNGFQYLFIKPNKQRMRYDMKF